MNVSAYLSKPDDWTIDFEIRRVACRGKYLPINAKIIHDFFLCGDSYHFMKAAVEAEEPK